MKNKPEPCDFTVEYKGEYWHCYELWRDYDGDPQYCVAETHRKGIRFERLIVASEVKK
jgi:hypothetical protein